VIFFIGLFLTWWPFVKWSGDHLVLRHWVDPNNPMAGIRTLGVLARIAICYFFASIIIYYLKPKVAFITGIIFLLGYWALCYLLGDKNDPYSMTGWFGNQVDRKVLGVPHMYTGEGMPFDPEGLMSALPAIVQVIAGYLVGNYIQKKGKGLQLLRGLFGIGALLILAGYWWDVLFPVNKKIWTSSYVVYTTGLAMVIIGIMIYLIEFKNIKGWFSKFFDVFGKNALFVFALSAFIPKTLGLIRLGDGVNPWNWPYRKLFIHIPGAKENGSLAFAIWVILLMWFICWWMDKKKIYVKV